MAVMDAEDQLLRIFAVQPQLTSVNEAGAKMATANLFAEGGNQGTLRKVYPLHACWMPVCFELTRAANPIPPNSSIPSKATMASSSPLRRLFPGLRRVFVCRNHRLPPSQVRSSLRRV